MRRVARYKESLANDRMAAPKISGITCGTIGNAKPIRPRATKKPPTTNRNSRTPRGSGSSRRRRGLGLVGVSEGGGSSTAQAGVGEAARGLLEAAEPLGSRHSIDGDDVSRTAQAD